MKKQKPQVSIIMGSKTDLRVMKSASSCLLKFSIPFEIKIVSAHRTPVEMMHFAQEASRRGIKVIIAGAGGAAHLPGMVASLTTLPVIGVPVQVGSLEGLDALLSIAQMPQGVPVATMAIDNAFNAGLLAVRIIAQSNPNLTKKLEKFQQEQKKKVTLMNKKISLKKR